MPNAVNARNVSLTYLDYSREKSTTTVRTAEFGDNASFSAAFADFENALAAVTSGVLNKRSIFLDQNVTSVPPTDVTAQREYKWLVSYEDTVDGRVYVFSIPCADATQVTFVENTDYVDLTAGGGATLKSAIEAFVRTPNTDNAIAVTSIKLVGRNI